MNTRFRARRVVSVVSVVSFVTIGSVAACTSSPRQAPAPARAAAGDTISVAQHAVAVPSDAATLGRIVDEGTTRSHVARDLEYLTDVIGPRLTGSAAARRANDWTARKFREYGMDSTWLEPWTFGIGWERGPATVRLLEPQRRELVGFSWAWTPGTNGPVAGDVVYLDARTERDFRERFAGKLRGAWVLLGPAANVRNPDAPPLSAGDSMRLDSIARAQFRLTEEERTFTGRRTALLAVEGVAGVVRDGAKEFGLLTMSGSPRAVQPYPYLVLPHGDYAQMQRLIDAGQRVRLEADVHNAFTRDTVPTFNTLAEIRGTEHPEQVVLLGAHLDSWDLGTGATDNAAGAIAVLEAARILKAAGVQPKRTIRFALFTGEEEGLLGSDAYARAHARELPSYQAVLVLDNGTGRITGMALQGRNELRDMWRTMLAPVAELGPFTVRPGNKGGTDHLSFIPYGVPGFNYDQLTRGYNHTHHSQVDVFDHAVPSDIAQAATVMATNAWQLANLPQLLPRNPQR